MRALRRVVTGEDASERALDLDGKRPLRPFRLSVLTTAEHEEERGHFFSYYFDLTGDFSTSMKIILLKPAKLKSPQSQM